MNDSQLVGRWTCIVPRRCTVRSRVGRAAFLLALASLTAFSAASSSTRGGYLVDPITGQLNSLVIDGTVYSSASDGAGGFFIGGAFGSVGGLSRPNVAHINADGSVGTWNPGTNFPVTAIARYGTTVYLGGTFSSVGGSARSRLAAVDVQSGAVLPWAPSADAQVLAIAQVGERVFVGGAFATVNGAARPNLAALDASSGALVSFPAFPDGQVYAIAANDTELIVGGEFIRISDSFFSHLAALSPTTGLSTRSLPGTNGWVGGLAVAGGDLYVMGGFGSCGGLARNGLAAVDLATSAVTEWNPGPGSTSSLCVDGDVIYVAGGGMIGGANRIGVARIDRQTGRARAWAPAFANPVGPRTVLAGPNWVFLGGTFGDPYQAPAGISNPLVARLPQFNGPVFATAMAGDTCFIGGGFSRVGTLGSGPPWVDRSCIAAVRWSTGEVLDWNPTVSGPVNSIVLYGNAVLLGGGFTNVNGDLHRRIALIDRTTGIADPWDPALDEAVSSMALDGSTLYVGGAFAHAAGVTRNAACAFSLPSLTLTSWDPNVYLGPVYSLLVANNQVFLGGKISLVHGLQRYALAEVDLVTGTPTSWAPVIGGTIQKLLVRDGVLYAAGLLSPVEGQGRGSGAAWTIANHQLLPWDPKANNVILSLQPFGGGMLVGGEFTSLGSQTHTRLGWVDLEGGSVIEPVGVVPEGPISAFGERDGFLTIGGQFAIINGAADQGWFATAPAPSLPTAVPAYTGSAGIAVGVHPNPSAQMPEIHWTLLKSGRVQVDIFDVVGRTLYQKVLPDVSSGAHSRRPRLQLTPGLYLLRVASPAGLARRKFLILR